jgi:hypothetical protein
MEQTLLESSLVLDYLLTFQEEFSDLHKNHVRDYWTYPEGKDLRRRMTVYWDENVNPHLKMGRPRREERRFGR